jgi:hypothetical protein
VTELYVDKLQSGAHYPLHDHSDPDALILSWFLHRGKVIKWFKQVGDEVKPGEVLVRDTADGKPETIPEEMRS